MRRSKAPSVLKKAKTCHDNNTREIYCSDPEDEYYAWGSRYGKLKENCYENKSIFNVVWRDVTARKHKIWKGDGILEVSNEPQKAILKDEAGKYMGCITKFNRSDLVPDFCMIIGGKEIEIQNEVVDENQLHELSKRRKESSNLLGQDSLPSEDKYEQRINRKSCGFEQLLVLKSPKLPIEKKINKETKSSRFDTDDFQSKNQPDKEEPDSCSSYLKTSTHRDYISSENWKEFMCFLRPSELQQLLFQKVLEYISSINFTSFNEIESLDVVQVLQLICNHPSLITNKNTVNPLVRHLIPFIPDWTEMGPFDSSKLEFVQYFLADLTRCDPQLCIILAKSGNVLNMLQGLCDFMDIECLRLTTNELLQDNKTQFITEFCLLKENSTRVILVNSEEVLGIFNFFDYCKKFIIFEKFSKNLNRHCRENCKDVIIYLLATAFSIEEILLIDAYNTDNIKIVLDELNNLTNADNDCCYLHWKIKCSCFESNEESQNIHEYQKQWLHFKSPFDMQLLKIAALENSSENVVSIFLKK